MVSTQHSRSRSRSRSRGVRNLSARVQAEWSSDEARPVDRTWVTEVYRKSVEILKWLESASDSSLKLFEQLPQNPHTKLYEQVTGMCDKLQVIKNLMNTHQGEIREVNHNWVLIHAPMPNPWPGGWYHKQYAQADYHDDRNVFISSGDNRNEHWQRRSRGFSLMRLMELYGNDFSAEVLL